MVFSFDSCDIICIRVQCSVHLTHMYKQKEGGILTTISLANMDSNEEYRKNYEYAGVIKFLKLRLLPD